MKDGFISMTDNDRFSKARGVYVLWFYLPESKQITIGKLGTFSFTPGIYAYCGSAQRNLYSRLERHERVKKNLHWHIDYFRAQALFLGSVVSLNQPKDGECRLAQELLKIPGAFYPAPRFGASDCRCPAHFIKVPIFQIKSGEG